MKKNYINATKAALTRRTYLTPETHIVHSRLPNLLDATIISVDGTRMADGGEEDPSTAAYSKSNNFWSETPAGDESVKDFWTSTSDEDKTY